MTMNTQQYKIYEMQQKQLEEVHSNTGASSKIPPKKKHLKLTYHLTELEKEEETNKQTKTKSQ